MPTPEDAGDQADPQRQRRAGDHHREQVAALLVAAERVAPRTAAGAPAPRAAGHASMSTRSGRSRRTSEQPSSSTGRRQRGLRGR